MLTTAQWSKQKAGEKRHSVPNLSSEVNFTKVMDNADLQYHLESNYVKQNLIISKYSEIPTLSEKLEINGLTAVPQDDGSIEFVDSDTKELVFVMPAPCMFDSKGNTGTITASIVQNGNDCTLTYKLDTAWLKTAVYPVIIDPTVSVPNGATQVDDTKLVENYPNSNYHLQTSFATGYTSSGHRLYSLVRFNNLPSLSGSQIYYATFTAKTDLSSSESTVGVCKVTSSWTSSSVTWGNKPSFDDIYSYNDISGSTGVSYTWDITDIARYWYTTHNYGLLLKTDEDTGAYMLWYSSDASSNHPSASITYDNTSPTEPTSLTTNPVATSSWATNATPILSWSGMSDTGSGLTTDPIDGDFDTPSLAKVQYQIDGGNWVDIPSQYGTPTQPIHNEYFDESASDPNNLFTLPALASGTHTIKIRGVDKVGNYSSNITKNVVYKVDSGLPTVTISSPSKSFIATSSTGIIPITGSIVDDTNGTGINSWQLSYNLGTAMTGGTLLASGTSAVSSLTTLANLDTSSFASGSLYTVWLTATDVAGNINTTSFQIIKDTAAEVGTKSYWTYSGFSTGSGNGNVNVASGNLVYQSTDFTFPSLIPMTMTRTYNSQDKIGSSLGENWNNSFDIKLYGTTDGNSVILKEGDGTLDHFTYNNGSYTPENGLFISLQKLGDNTWVATTKDNTQYSFDSSMKLNRITDLNGNYLQYAYNPDSTIKTVTSSANEVVSFSYYKPSDSNGTLTGLLKTVTDPATRVFTYAYNSSRQLISRSFPLTGTTNWTEQFSYNTSGLLSGITDGNGNQTGLQYDANKRVTQVTYPITSIYTTYSYDDTNHKTTVANQLAQANTYTYDTNGLVTRMTDQMWTSDSQGHYTNYTYDQNKYLVTGTTTTDYNPVDQTSTTVTWSYDYDSNGNQTLVIDPLGHYKTYTYDSYNRMTSEHILAADNVTVFASTTYTYTYNSTNHYWTMVTTDPVGHVTTNEYYTDGQLHKTTDNFGKITTYDYNGIDTNSVSHNWLSRTTYPTDGTTSTKSYINQYDPMGNPVYEQDVNENDTKKEYDNLGHLVASYADPTVVVSGGSGVTHITNGFGGGTSGGAGYTWTNDTSSVTYDNDDNVIQSVSNENIVTNYTYDTVNRCLTITIDPSGKNEVTTYSYSYDSNNNNDYVIQTTDEVGNISYEYYDANNEIVRTVGSNTTVNNTYDSVGNEVRSVDDQGKTTVTQYDKLNRQTDVYAGPSGAVVHSIYAYDLLGNTSSYDDGQGTVTATTHDLTGRVLSETVTNNNVSPAIVHTTTYTYDYVDPNDPNGYVQNSITNEDGTKTTYLNSNGNTCKEVDVLTGGTTFTYLYNTSGSITSIKVGTANSRELVANNYNNSSGSDQITQVTYGNGELKHYTYNSDTGYLTSERYDTDSSDYKRFEYGYDPAGNLNDVKDNHQNIETRYTYDDANRITAVSEGLIGFTTAMHSYTITYTGDNVTSVSETVGSQTNSMAYSFYDGTNKVMNANFSYGTNNTAKLNWIYDSYNRPWFRDVYDNNTTKIFDTTTTYTQNSYATAYVSTLRNMNIGNGYDKTLTYTYDGNHNITSVSDGTNTTSYAYDSDEQLVRENNQAAGKTWVWAYNSGKNITSKTEYAYTAPDQTPTSPISTTPYTYSDSRGWADMLTSYNGNTITYDGSGNPLTDGTWIYTWEAGKNLVGLSKTGNSTSYTYNDDGIRTSKTVNGTTTLYSLRRNLVTAESNGTDTIYYRYDNDNNLISMSLNGTEYYYFHNAQGDIMGLFDRTGTVVVEYSYDAWGNILSITGSLASTVGAKNPYRYKGYRFDNETGWYYLQSRYYNPKFGRFIDADDIQYAGDNMFEYCYNSPLMISDIKGETPIDVPISGVGPIAQSWANSHFYESNYIRLEEGMEILYNEKTKQLSCTASVVGWPYNISWSSFTTPSSPVRIAGLVHTHPGSVNGMGEDDYGWATAHHAPIFAVQSDRSIRWYRFCASGRTRAWKDDQYSNCSPIPMTQARESDLKSNTEYHRRWNTGHGVRGDSSWPWPDPKFDVVKNPGIKA
jgi:RHS repeat-associated protein